LLKKIEYVNFNSTQVAKLCNKKNYYCFSSPFSSCKIKFKGGKKKRRDKEEREKREREKREGGVPYLYLCIVRIASFVCWLFSYQMFVRSFISVACGRPVRHGNASLLVKIGVFINIMIVASFL
jgi:hypothetical protein